MDQEGTSGSEPERSKLYMYQPESQIKRVSMGTVHLQPLMRSTKRMTSLVHHETTVH